MTGEAGYHNLGDEGMALASAQRLNRYFPNADLVATGLDPLGAVLRQHARIVPWPLLAGELPFPRSVQLARKVSKKIGVSEDFLDPIGRPMEHIFEDQFRNNSEFRSRLHEIEKADLMFDMGHGGINDIFGPFMLCFFYFLAGRLGKPLFISGQTVGPLFRAQSRRMVRDTLHCAHTIGLRDKDVSYRTLVDEVHVDPERVKLAEIGDDTLDLNASEPDWDKFQPSARGLILSGEFFAVQWRGTDYTQQVAGTQQLLPLIEAIRISHETSGLPAIFVPMSWESDGDALVAARIHNSLAGALPFTTLWHPLSAAEAKWVLRQARFGIGSSYHFHVFMLSQGVPSIGLVTNKYYDVKLRGAFAAYHHSIDPLPYTIDLASGLRMHKALQQVMNWSDEDSLRLRGAAETLRKRWHEAFVAFANDAHLRP